MGGPRPAAGSRRLSPAHPAGHIVPRLHSAAGGSLAHGSICLVLQDLASRSPGPQNRKAACGLVPFCASPPSPSHTGPPARAFHMGRVTAFCLLGCLLWKWPGDVCSSACVCSGHIILGLGLPLWEPCFSTFPPPPLSTKRDMS